MSRLFIRSLSTSLPTTAPAAGPSRHQAVTQPQNILSTLPIAVRKRRAEYPHTSPQPSPVLAGLPHAHPLGAQASGRGVLDPPQESDARIKGPAKRFPLKLEESFQALRLNGQYKGDEASARKAFLKGNVAWRSRVRGVSVKKLDYLLKSVGGRPGVGAAASGQGEVVAEGESTDTANASTSTSHSTPTAVSYTHLTLPTKRIV